MKSLRIKLLFKYVEDFINFYFLAAVLICFIIGDIIGCLAVFPDWLFIPIIIFCLVMFVLALVFKKFKLLLIAALFLGGFWSSIYQAELETFPYEDGRAVEISGKVEEILESKDNYLANITTADADSSEDKTRFVLKGETTSGWEGRIMVTVYGIDIRNGDIVHLVGNVKEWTQQQNDYITSEMDYLQSIGVAAYVQAITSETEILALEQVNPFIRAVSNVKDNLYLQMESLPDQQQKILKGLAFGDKTLLSGYDSSILSKTGVAHVFAVSGLHMGFVIAFVMIIIKLLSSKIKIPRVIQLAAVILCTLFYAAMCGFTFSVIRAVIMGLAAAFAVIYNENYSSKLALIYAAFICVLIQPFSVCNVGFQLSFLATFALLFTYDIWKYLVKSNAVATVLAAQFITFPIVAYNFNVLTFVGIILSPIVTFAVGFVVIFAFLSILFSLISFGSFFLFIAGFMGEVIYKLCLWAAELPGSWLCVVKPSVLSVLIYYCLLFLGYYFLNIAKQEELAKKKASQ
jgi:competence protein ComEC